MQRVENLVSAEARATLRERVIYVQFHLVFCSFQRTYRRKAARQDRPVIVPLSL